MYCTRCGHIIKKDTNFCTKCGKQVHKSAEEFTADVKAAVAQVTEERKPAVKKGSRDHSALFHWLIVTIVLLIIAFSVPGESMLITLFLGLLSAAYTYYIYQGGGFIIVNKYLELFVKLFTEGYNKKLSADHPPSKAWIVWAILTLTVFLNTILGKLPNGILGIIMMVPAGVYTGYLYKGGKYVYVPIVIMLLTLGMLGYLFNG